MTYRNEEETLEAQRRVLADASPGGIVEKILEVYFLIHYLGH